jgi:hypothetical protein
MSVLLEVIGEKTKAFSEANLGENFWTSRMRVEMPDAYLTDDQRKAFAKALKQMPTVSMLLNPNQITNVDRRRSEWKNGGRLVDKVVGVNDLAGPKKALGARRIASKKFRRKLNRADELVRVVVEPDLLAQIPLPKVSVHATAAQDPTAPWGFRAYASPGDVHLAFDEPMNVMAHEVGHHLENYLPMKRWHDVHILLGERHTAAGGGTAKSGATPPFTHLSEGRYGGEYVTGKYTSTAYAGGNAEVVSMAMEYFAKPRKALKLIEGDPQHAAIVLRSFRPQEYKATEALRPFDKYLPHKPQKG